NEESLNQKNVVIESFKEYFIQTQKSLTEKDSEIQRLKQNQIDLESKLNETISARDSKFKEYVATSDRVIVATQKSVFNALEMLKICEEMYSTVNNKNSAEKI
uniref:Uncharacterized protein n=1 Tax=Panagrolaimus sp. ES5 TaxID=591445 RepID=A0AC34G8A5_9BILA